MLIIISHLVTSIELTEPKLNTTLEKTQYNPKEKLVGNILFEFTGPVENQYLIADIGNVHTQIKLLDALQKVNYSVKATPPVQELYDDLSSGIIFPPLSQKVGFAASYKATVTEVNEDIDIFGIASNNNYPKFPYLDLKADGTKEWLYLGNITAWESTAKNSGFLNEQESGNFIKVKKSDPYPYLCEVINLGKDVSKVNVSVKYRLADQGVIVHVRMFGPLTFANNDFSAAGLETEDCILPQIINEISAWTSCVLEFGSPTIRNSDTMFCVYAPISTAIGEDLFYIDRDNSGTTTGARSAECKKAVDGYSCKKRTNWNYFIKVNLPEYDGLLKNGVKFAEGLKSSVESFEKKVIDALAAGKCNPDEIGNCVIPFEVGSQSEGILSLPNNLILIDGSTITFKKYREKAEIITNITGKDLSKGLNITLSLTVFDNLTAPEVDYVQILPLKISLGSRTVFTDVEVGSAAPVEDLNTTITKALSKINQYASDADLKPILDFISLDLNSKKLSLQAYATQLAALESNTTISEQNKTAGRTNIQTQVTTLLQNLPQDLFIINKLSNVPVIPPTQIPDIYLPEDKRTDLIREHVSSIQKNTNIASNALVYKIRKPSGSLEVKTLISREVSTSLANPYLIEDIPSSLASSGAIQFKEPTTSLGQTNILKLPVKLGSATMIYQIDGDVTSQLSSIKTLIVSVEGASSEEFKEPVCGDSICTIPLEDKIICPEDCSKRIPWGTISTVLIVFLLLIAYINLYKGKYSFTSLFQKKNLFKSEADKINLINYIERASQHTSKEDVKKILISRGWTIEQIDYAFRKVKIKRK